MIARIPAPVRRALRRSRELVGDRPAFLPLVLALTPEGFSRTISPATELVVEGYPRSGTTFAVAAFALAQNRPVVVSSHVHVPAQVKVAVRRRVPTLVVVREPVDAAASLIVAAPHVSPVAALREYAHHHRQIVPLADQVVVATFDQVTSDMGAVICRLNTRFGTSFERFVHTQLNVEAAFAVVDRRHAEVYGSKAVHALARPSEARKQMAEKVRSELTAPALQPLRDRAQAAYEVLAARSTQ